MRDTCIDAGILLSCCELWLRPWLAGDTAVRSLLEKMAECASNAYLGILVRWVYEGVIDDPYGEFFIAENKSLQKPQDYEAKYWRQRYSLKDGSPSFLAIIVGTILITGKYLNVMRECGHHVQYDLMGKLRSIKHYLLLDQASLVQSWKIFKNF
ncbi:hypothetical protein ABKV19_022757 [Rosa sericea]